MQFVYGIAKNRKAVRLMKCPKCGINLLEHVETCPFCKTPISANVSETQNKNNNSPTQSTGRFSAVDPKRDSYDFDLQYTLTFKDSGEIKQAIADMDAGITPNILNERVSDGTKKRSETRYTLEEMQAAALRAQERRERRKNGKSSKGISAPKKRINSSERIKLSAMRSAKEKSPKNSGDSRSNLKGLLFGAGVLVLVVAIIIGIVNVCAFFAHKDPEYPTVYTKGNELYSFYDGKEELLTSNFITVYSDDAKADQDKKSSSDSKIDAVNELTEKNLIFVSDTGAVTYFFENFNMNTRAGNLVYYENGREKSRTVLGQNVYYDVEIGSNGSSILYLKNADENGAHGELCYWNPKLKGEVSIESDITANSFKFSQDCTSVTYIKNFNPDVYSGDLCYMSLLDGADPAKRVDEKVAFVFGTTPKSKIYFYAKNYDKKTGTYDLYVQSDTEGPKMIAEKGLLAPIISKKTETAFVYSNYSKNFQTLSCVDFVTGTNTMLAEEVTEVIKVRIDDGAVIYSKAYETEKADYYFVNAKTPNPQTVATAINISAKNVVSFDTSDDFSKIAYIGGFDKATNRGALYTMSIINDYAGSEMRISDDAYSCDVSADGAVIRFATSFNPEFNTVNLVSYSNSNTLGLADGVGVGAFTFDKLGEYAVYAKEIDRDLSVGKIQSVNQKGKIKSLADGISSYGLKKDGTVLLLERVGEGDVQTSILYRSKSSGGKVKNIAEGVTKVLSY